MKKLFSLFLIGFTVFTFAQESSPAYFIGFGGAKNGGFNFELGQKKQNSFGFYIAARGLNTEYDYFSGIDYSDIASEKTLSISTEDKPAFGITLGTIYNFKDSNFSFGAGLGYGIKQKITVENVVYDFDSIKDEYGTYFYADKKSTITAEAFIDYSLKKELHNSLGFRLGYNSLHNIFGSIYYSF